MNAATDRLLAFLHQTELGKSILADLAGQLARVLHEHTSRTPFHYAIVSRKLSAADLAKLVELIGPIAEDAIPREYGRPTGINGYWTGEGERGNWHAREEHHPEVVK